MKPDIQLDEDVGDNLEEEETRRSNIKDEEGDVPLERKYLENAKEEMTKDCRRMKHIRRPTGPSSFQSNHNES